MTVLFRRPGPRNVLATSLILVVFLGGCLPAEYVPSYPNNSSRVARNFLTTLEIGMESENLQDIARLVDDRYGGFSNGRQTLMSQMKEIFEQYEVRELNLEARRITPFQGGVTVRADWTLRWDCETVNSEQGCPEKAKETTVVRRGTTTFELVQNGMRWTIREQTGNVLIGLFEPGEADELRS